MNRLLLSSTVERLSLEPLFAHKRHILGFSPVGPVAHEPSMLLDFKFGDRAREQTTRVLTRQLFDLLKGEEAMTYQALLENIANHSPADSDLIEEVLFRLKQERRISLMGAQDGEKRSTTLKSTDRLWVTPQEVFDFGRREK